MADRLVRMAIRSHNRNVKLYRADEIEMHAMFAGDLADTKKVASLIRQNKLGKAWDVVDEMDTCAREALSDSVYNWLYKVTE